MNRHIKSPKNGRLQEIVPAGTMRFLDFLRVQLPNSETYSGQTGSREAVVDVFSGSASIRIATPDGKEHAMGSVGERRDVFSGPPAMVYIPPNSAYEIRAGSENLDLGVFSAPSKATAAPALLREKEVVAKQVGQGNWQRLV